MAKKDFSQMTDIEILNYCGDVTFEEFKKEAEERFRGEAQMFPEYTDLRIYNDLPFNEVTKLKKYTCAKPQYWMMFSYEEDHYLIISVDPDDGSANYYSDYHYVINGRTYGFFSPLCPHYNWHFALTDIHLHIRNLKRFRETIMRRTFMTMDSNFTDAWKNGDSPLSFEPTEGSLICFIDDITKAKKNPDPAWKGMQIEAYFRNFEPLCPYAVKF